LAIDTERHLCAMVGSTRGGFGEGGCGFGGGVGGGDGNFFAKL